MTVKYTDEMYRLKSEVEENFEGKKTKDQATNLPWMN